MRNMNLPSHQRPNQMEVMTSRTEPQRGASGKASAKLSNQEEVELFRERLFAQEKQLQRQLLEYKERLNQHDYRLRAMEHKLNVSGAQSANVSSDSSRQETAAWTAALLLEDRVRKLEGSHEQISESCKAKDSLQQQDSGAGCSGKEVEEPLQSDVMSMIRELNERQQQHHVNLMSLHESTARVAHFSDKIEMIPEVLAKCETLEGAWSRNELGSSKSLDTPSMSTTKQKIYCKTLREDPEYVLSNSIWDLLLFIGTKELRSYGSMFSLILAFVNILLQVAFVMVCNANFIEPDIDTRTVEGANFFRHQLGHDQRFIDPHTQRSLARRICQSHQIELEIGVSQGALVERVRKYLRTEDALWRRCFNGQTMCFLALCIWTLAVLREFQSIFNFSAAARRLPNGGANAWTQIGVRIRTHEGDIRNSLYFEAVNSWRIVFIFGAIVLRSIIAANLLFTGCIWLATTVDVRELLLNAIALEFVLQIDEILFSALVPGHAKAIITNFMPLTRHEWGDHRGCEVRTAVLCVSFPILASFFYLWYTQPMIDDMESAKNTLCSDPLDFVLGRDYFNFVQADATSKDVTSSSLWHRELHKLHDEAVAELMDTGGNVKHLIYSNPKTRPLFTVADMVDMSPRRLSNFYNPMCEDIFDSYEPGSTVYTYVEKLFGLTTCYELKGVCLDSSNKNGTIVRALCSVSCGCDRPDSGQMLLDSNFGCPQSCQSGAMWITTRSTASCFNPTVRQLYDSMNWQRYVDTIDVKELNEAMAVHGCDFWLHISDQGGTVRDSFCRGHTKHGQKSISMICPETCSCGMHKTAPIHCPIGPNHEWCYCGNALRTRKEGRKLCRPSLCDKNKSVNALLKEAQHYIGSELLNASVVAGICGDN